MSATRGRYRAPSKRVSMTQAAGCELLLPQAFFGAAADERAKDSDYALARAAAGGVMAAVGELYVRHYRRVYTLCMRMTHSVEDSEDLTQEVFILLFRKLGSFRGESQFTTWLHRMTVNHVLMHFRHKKVRVEQPTDDGELPQRAEPETENPSSMPVVDRIALDNALSKLTPGYRTVFVLYDIEGYEHEEVASILGCSVGTSKSQLHKARRNLKRLLRTGRKDKVRLLP